MGRRPGHRPKSGGARWVTAGLRAESAGHGVLGDDHERGHHTEHPLVNFDVGEDVAMECPSPEFRGVDHDVIPLSRSHQHRVRPS